MVINRLTTKSNHSGVGVRLTAWCWMLTAAAEQNMTSSYENMFTMLACANRAERARRQRLREAMLQTAATADCRQSAP